MSERTKSIWIARDMNGSLYLYLKKPIRGENSFYVNTDCTRMFANATEVNNYCQITSTEYTEITWENSPKEFVIKE